MTQSQTFRTLVLAGLVAFAARTSAAEDAAPAAESAPAPAAVAPTGPRRWMLNFSHGPLRHVRDGGATYHYMVITVENRTGLVREWKPFVQAVVDTGRTHVACGCAGAVEQVRRRERNPSLLSLEASAGNIGSGEKKTFAAVFGPIDASWNRVTVLVHGLVNPLVIHRVQKYGEKVVIADAAYEQRNEKVMEDLRKAAKESGGEVPPPTQEYQELVERRAYAIEYQRKGDEFRPEDDPIDFVGERWVVVGNPILLKATAIASGGSK